MVSALLSPSLAFFLPSDSTVPRAGHQEPLPWGEDEFCRRDCSTGSVALKHGSHPRLRLRAAAACQA